MFFVFIQLDLNGFSFTCLWCCHVYIYILGRSSSLTIYAIVVCHTFSVDCKGASFFFNQGWFTSGNGPRISKEIISLKGPWSLLCLREKNYIVCVINRGFNVWTFDLWVSRYILDKTYKNTKVLDFQKGTYTKTFLWQKITPFFGPWVPRGACSLSGQFWTLQGLNTRFLTPPHFCLTVWPLQPFKLRGCKRNSENRVSLSRMDFAGPSQRKDGGGEA